MGTEERTIELTVTSATDLKKVKKFGGEQKCYVVAYIYPAHKQTTKADPYGGVNPTWNAKLTLTCLEADLHRPAAGSPTTTSSSPSSSSSSSSHMITLEIFCHRSSMLHSGDKLVGTVTIPLHDVGATPKAGGLMGAFDVHLPSGELQGTLNVSVKLGGKRTLEEYEDPTAPRLSSYSSDKGASSSLVRRTPTVSTKSANRAYYPPPTSDFQGPSKPLPSPDTISGENIVMGYPVSSYAFAPLGQVPMTANQQQFGQDGINHGPYGSYLTAGALNQPPGQDTNLGPYGSYSPTKAPKQQQQQLEQNANHGPYGDYSHSKAQNQQLEENTYHGHYGAYAPTTTCHHKRCHRKHGCRNSRVNGKLEENTNHGSYGGYAPTTTCHRRRHHQKHGCQNPRANGRIGHQRRKGLVAGGLMLLSGVILGVMF